MNAHEKSNDEFDWDAMPLDYDLSDTHPTEPGGPRRNSHVRVEYGNAEVTPVSTAFLLSVIGGEGLNGAGISL